MALTDKGVERVEQLLGIDNIVRARTLDLPYQSSYQAETLFKRDRDCVTMVEVIIVDEHTGRLMQGRRCEGLHQAVS